MQRLHSLFLILILTGCAATNAGSPQIKSVAGTSAPASFAEQVNSANASKVQEVPHDPPARCSITQAPDVPFVPPAPYLPTPPERYENQFWYGTPELWTMLGADATWYALPQDKNGYSQKVFWWSQSFDTKVDPFPAFTVILERLDASAPSAPIVAAEQATNASADFGTAMLTGVEIPSTGCWKVTGQYGEAELSFVVWVAP